MRTLIPQPKSVVIGPHVWTIHWTQKEFEKFSDEEISGGFLETRKGLAGFLQTDQSRIVISPNMPLSQLQDTLLHEILHAVCATFGFKDQAPFKGYMGEERIISLFTPYLLFVLKNNKKIVDYLCQR